MKAIPFRWIPKLFSGWQLASPMKEKSRTQCIGREDHSGIQSVETAVGSWQSKELGLIKMAIMRSGRISPWKNRCLVSSLAGRCMLRRRKIDSQLSLGITKNSDGRPVAHAWLKSGECELVEKNGDYTILYSF